jgi:predicted NACHT family NTPase
MLDSFFTFIGIEEKDFNTIVGVLSLLLTLACIFIPPIRRFLVRVFYKFLNVLGFTRWVYRKKFLTRHSVVHNIYLDKPETLDLRATYIPLHVDRPGRTGRVPAVQLLSDPNERRLIIVGDPGTGKTTLVKAFGTGVLRPFTGLRVHEGLHVTRTRETPIIADLRHFAAADYATLSLAEYIINHVFRDQMKIKHGDTFLRSLLRKERCLVLLDGLDEVSQVGQPGRAGR